MCLSLFCPVCQYLYIYDFRKLAEAGRLCITGAWRKNNWKDFMLHDISQSQQDTYLLYDSTYVRFPENQIHRGRN